MANEQNLKPGAHKLTREEQSAGGKASGKARRDRANLKKCLEFLLETEMKDKTGKEISGAEALAAKLFQTAMKGDVRAFEVLRDTAGQKPADVVKQESTVIDMSKFTTEQIKEMLDDEV